MLHSFDHVHSAHCESGAFAALLRHNGLKLSEPMVFGIGSGLFFLYLPFLRIYGMPMVSYRDMPNAIIERGSRRLGVKLSKARFRDDGAGMRALDALLDRECPVGIQTGVFWLPYVPRDMRFQFNGHHLIAYGRDGGEYLLSDSVMESVVRCPAEDLRRARFSKGPLAPQGMLYYVEDVGRSPDIERAALEGLRSTVGRMLRIPIPLMGIAGIRWMARALRAWPRRLPARRAKSHLAHVIRMQEEIGTGGAGFRFMFAAFLDEAGTLLGRPVLREAAGMFSELGDRWRDFAVGGAQLIRGADDGPAAWEALSQIVLECARREEQALRAVAAAL